MNQYLKKANQDTFRSMPTNRAAAAPETEDPSGNPYFERARQLSKSWQDRNMRIRSTSLGDGSGMQRGALELTIGRAPDCNIVLSQVGVSLHHATLYYENERLFIRDNNSTYGTYVNGVRISRTVELREYDVISITNTTFIYNRKKLLHCTDNTGMQIISSWVTKKIDKGKTLVDEVDLRIEPGEFVAIIGCSGAGKTTYMKSIGGYIRPTAGSVYVNGADLYDNYGFYKNRIAFVPQEDIVYRNVSLETMLTYSARLRMPKDSSEHDIKNRINEVLEFVGLSDRKEVLIKNLSGGQIKRASIAVELIADPGVIFLDEPTSGLDPGTERSFMETMRRFSDKGKTVVMVTHTTQSLHLCDKIAVLGSGGKLCFFGTPEECWRFFETDDFIGIYEMIEQQPSYYKRKFEESGYKKRNAVSAVRRLPVRDTRNHFSTFRQWNVLQQRYFRLIVSDTKRMALLALQPILISILIGVLVQPDSLSVFNSATSTLFVLSCASIWIGCADTVQEVCKERSITERECKTSVPLSSYVLSKVSVIGIITLIQSVLMVVVLYLFLEWRFVDLLFGSFANIIITTFLTTFSAAMMGLLVSSVSQNSDRAMGMTPLLLIPQILFSGILFEMTGVMKALSYFIQSRWSMKGYGVSLDFNSLPTRMELDYPEMASYFRHEAESIYDCTVSSLCQSWVALLTMAVVFIIASVVALRLSFKVR